MAYLRAFPMISLRDNDRAIAVQRFKVVRVRLRRGRHVLLGSTIGAGAGLAVGLIADYSRRSERGQLLATLITTPVGAGVGAGLGAKHGNAKQEP